MHKYIQWILILVVAIISFSLGIYLSLHHHPKTNTPTFIEPQRTYHHPISLMQQIKKQKNPGRIVFQSYCASCHGKNPEIDLGAPQIGDSKAWDKTRALGASGLLQITQKGYGAMPARGGCFECSDHLLLQTIEYILKQTPKTQGAPH